MRVSSSFVANENDRVTHVSWPPARENPPLVIEKKRCSNHHHNHSLQLVAIVNRLNTHGWLGGGWLKKPEQGIKHRCRILRLGKLIEDCEAPEELNKHRFEDDDDPEPIPSH